MILNCAIVDDEPLALELLRSYVEKTSFLRLVGRYSSAVQAMTKFLFTRRCMSCSLIFKCPS